LIKLIDLSFYASNECNDMHALIKQHEPALSYIDHIKQHINIQVIKHLDTESTQVVNGVKYSGFKSSNNFWHIPNKTLNYIRHEDPDIVIVQGLVFPFQLIRLYKKLGKEKIILVQHHGELPYKGYRKWLQRMADRFVKGYLFTSIENAEPWISNGIIGNRNKCFELLEASTNFKRQDKIIARQQLDFRGEYNFLWVGRLNAGKDPLTVIKAFELFSTEQPGARLYMVYHTEELLPEIKKIMEHNNSLAQKIILKGSMPHEELERWYNAADFYISGSHHESTGYTLLEAMACGCIPVVTNIPSFNKLTANGKYGMLYEPGDWAGLTKLLKDLHKADRYQLANDISTHFQQQLSSRSIAAGLYAICKKLAEK